MGEILNQENNLCRLDLMQTATHMRLLMKFGNVGNCAWKCKIKHHKVCQ